MNRPTQLRIGLDVDGVLADYMAGVAAMGRSLGHAVERALHGPTRYDLVEPGWFPDAASAGAAMSGLLGKIGDLALLDATAPDAVSRLRSAGHRVVVVTARDERIRDDTSIWLGRHGIDADEVVFERNKSSTGCDVYLDDAAHNVTELRDAGCLAVVYDAPYNRDIGGLRVSSTAEFADMVLDGGIVTPVR